MTRTVLLWITLRHQSRWTSPDIRPRENLVRGQKQCQNILKLLTRKYQFLKPNQIMKRPGPWSKTMHAKFRKTDSESTQDKTLPDSS